MSAPNKLEGWFQSAGRSTVGTALSIIVTLAMCIVILVLSIMQALPVNFEGFEDSDVCNQMVYLTPYKFRDETGGWYACPWRPRNSIFRIIITSLIILGSMAALSVVFDGPGGRFAAAWNAVVWCYFFMFIMMFIIFILDCDAVTAGLNSCNHDFKLNGNPFFGLITADGEIVEPDPDICSIDPFVWIIVCDLVAFATLFATYKVTRYHDLSQGEMREHATKSVTVPQSQPQSNGDILVESKPEPPTHQKQVSEDPFAEY